MDDAIDGTDAEVEALGRDLSDIEDAQGGDRAAFERLYVAYAPMVHGLLLAHAPVHDVDDLVQDVFLVAWHRLADLREPSAFAGWLAKIARRRAVDRVRSHRATETLKSDPAVVDPAIAEAHEVLAVIRSLPEAYREPLVLRLVEGMTGPEIAMKTGLTAGSVRVNLHRGMAMLKNKLAGRPHDG